MKLLSILAVFACVACRDAATPPAGPNANIPIEQQAAMHKQGAPGASGMAPAAPSDKPSGMGPNAVMAPADPSSPVALTTRVEQLEHKVQQLQADLDQLRKPAQH